MALDYDRHFRRADFNRYAMQCGLAGAVVFVLLLLLDAVTQTVLIAALGASAFIAFAVPRSPHSGPRHMIGGYIVGICAGSLMAMLNAMIDASPGIDHAIMIVCGAVAISLAMFTMVVHTNRASACRGARIRIGAQRMDLSDAVGRTRRRDNAQRRQATHIAGLARPDLDLRHRWPKCFWSSRAQYRPNPESRGNTR